MAQFPDIYVGHNHQKVSTVVAERKLHVALKFCFCQSILGLQSYTCGWVIENANTIKYAKKLQNCGLVY